MAIGNILQRTGYKNKSFARLLLQNSMQTSCVCHFVAHQASSVHDFHKPTMGWLRKRINGTQGGKQGNGCHCPIKMVLMLNSDSYWEVLWNCLFISTHHMASWKLVCIGSNQWLLPDGTKPLSTPMLTYHTRCLVAMGNCSKCPSFTWVQWFFSFETRCGWVD